MASGKFHDKVNIFTGSLIVAFFVLLQLSLDFVIAFGLGWLVATLIFSPDTDLRPKKRTGALQFFLYPYSILFKHRGLSHHLIWGTFTRVVYAVIIFSILVYILNGLGHIDFSLNNLNDQLIYFFTHFDLALPQYRIFLGIYLGMFSADVCHIVIDILSSGIKKFFRWLF